MSVTAARDKARPARALATENRNGAPVTAARGKHPRPARTPAGIRNVPVQSCYRCRKKIPATEPLVFWGGHEWKWSPWCESCFIEEKRRQDDESHRRYGFETSNTAADDYDPFQYHFTPKTCVVCGRPQRGGGGNHNTYCSQECQRQLRTVLRRTQRESSTDLDCVKCGEQIGGAICYVYHPRRSAYCASCFVAYKTQEDSALLERYGRDGPLGVWKGRGRLLPGDDGYNPLAGRIKCEVCGRDVVNRRYCSDRCEYKAGNLRRRVGHESRRCVVCEEPFTPRRKDARYCSSACRQDAYRKRKDGGQ